MFGNIHIAESGEVTYNVPEIMTTNAFVTAKDFDARLLTAGKLDHKPKQDPTKNSTTVRLLYDNKPFNLVTPTLKIPYAPTGTDYNGKAQHLSYFLPLQAEVEGALNPLLAAIEVRTTEILFGMKLKAFDDPAAVKSPLDVQTRSLVYASDKTNDDGEVYAPIFQPALPKKYRGGRYTDHFDVECDIHKVDGSCERAVKLDVTNLETYLPGGSEVTCIIGFRSVRIVSDVVHFDVTVRQLDVQQKEVNGLRKGTLRSLLKPNETADDDDVESLHWNHLKQDFVPARVEYVAERKEEEEDDRSIESYEEIVYQDKGEPAKKKPAPAKRARELNSPRPTRAAKKGKK